MDEKLLVTVRADADVERVRQSGTEILAAYPHSLLVRAAPDQRESLGRAGLEAASLPRLPIQLSGASFDFDAARAAEAAAPTGHDLGRQTYVLVRPVGPVAGAWLDELRANGATVHASLPGFVLLVGLLPGHSAAIQALPWVEAITPYRAAMKISPRLRPGTGRTLGARDLAAVNLAGASLVVDDLDADEQVEISVFPGATTAEIAARVRDEGGVVLGETAEAVIAVVARGRIAPLAQQPAVQAIVPFAPPDLTNDLAAESVGVQRDRQFGELSLTGAGQVVAVADSGLDTGDPATIHPDLRDRIVDIVRCPIKPGYLEYLDGPAPLHDGPADSGSGHGTHVAGSVLGNGSAAAEQAVASLPRGIAPDARLYFQALEKGVKWKSLETLTAEGRRPFRRSWPTEPFGLYAVPDDLNELFEPAYAAGARIHTNAWGSNRATALGSYNAMARAVDAFLWSHRDMLVLFSAGNTPSSTRQQHQGHGVADRTTVGPPGTAKNCLTVGACNEEQAPDSWRPTDDRRSKPDVEAPGTSLLSVRSSVHLNPNGPTINGGDLPADHPLHGLYCWRSGSSTATSLAAGAAALVRQYLVQERGHILGGAKPSGALLKALIVNGAVPRPGHVAGEVPPGQSRAAGFGVVNVKAALGLDDAPPVFFSDEPDLAVGTGETRFIELEAVSPGDPLKVTLVWTDAPSLANLGGLQNALYLQLCDPRGNVLDGDETPYPTATNNVQQIVVPEPVAGTYEVRVRGVNVVAAQPGTAPDEPPRQDFALAASNARAAARPDSGDTDMPRPG